jgi:hypothetical protein
MDALCEKIGLPAYREIEQDLSWSKTQSVYRIQIPLDLQLAKYRAIGSFPWPTPSGQTLSGLDGFTIIPPRMVRKEKGPEQSTEWHEWLEKRSFHLVRFMMLATDHVGYHAIAWFPTGLETRLEVQGPVCLRMSTACMTIHQGLLRE